MNTCERFSYRLKPRRIWESIDPLTGTITLVYQWPWLRHRGPGPLPQAPTQEIERPP